MIIRETSSSEILLFISLNILTLTLKKLKLKLKCFKVKKIHSYNKIKSDYRLLFQYIDFHVHFIKVKVKVPPLVLTYYAFLFFGKWYTVQRSEVLRVGFSLNY